MRPRIESMLWRTLEGDTPAIRRWHVYFTDTCGCYEEEHFPSFEMALRFAGHIANGGDRWVWAG